MDQERLTYLATCENVLSSPDNIDANELAGYMNSQSHLGINDHITSIL